MVTRAVSVGAKNAGDLALKAPQVVALGLATPALQAAAAVLPTVGLRKSARSLSERALYKQEALAIWFKHNRPWIIFIFSIVVLAFAVAFSTTFLLDLYNNRIIPGTTGEPWTHIMRRHGWLLIVPSLVIFGGFVFSFQATSDDLDGLPNDIKPRLRAKVTSRLIGLLIVALGIGFIYGHVFWGG